MVEKFKIIGMAIFLIVFSGCGGGSSGGGSVTWYVATIAGTAGNHGSSDGVGPAAQFYLPVGITTDGTNLYVTDYNNHTIRKILLATAAVTTIAGTAGNAGSADGTGLAASFYFPYGITTDGTNLYVADSNNNTIRKIVLATGAVTTIAGTAGNAGSADGTGAVARFSMPRGITTDGKNLYVADSNNNTIRKIVLATGAVTTIAGIPGVTGYADAAPGTAATFHWPVGITTDGTNLYVTDSLNNTIRQVVISTTAVTTIAGTAGTIGHADGFGLSATFNVPAGITTDGTNLYVADSNNNTIRQVVISTEAVSTMVGLPLLEGAADGSQAGATFFDPLGITILGTNLYVADTYNDTIREVY